MIRLSVLLTYKKIKVEFLKKNQCKIKDNYFLFSFLTGILFLFRIVCSAQDQKEQSTYQEKVKHDDIKPIYKNSLKFLPVVYYTPETHLAGGVVGIYLFKTKKDSSTRTSNIDFAAIYTINRQIIINPIVTMFTKNEMFFLRSYVLYTQFPEFFYGIGSKGLEKDKEKISYNAWRVHQRLLAKILPKFFGGLQYDYMNIYDLKFPNGTKYNNSLTGFDGSKSSGLGAAFQIDMRDNILNPSRGYYIELSNLNYGNWMGGKFNFTNFIIDFRKYFGFSPKSILALQTYFNFNSGDVPFKQMATLGGHSLMRGYYNGRFRDNNSTVFQAEWRRNIYGRFGATFFGNMGQVMSNPMAFYVSDIKISGGMGVRFLIDKQERLNFRFDAAFGENSRGFYFNIAEAF